MNSHDPKNREKVHPSQISQLEQLNLVREQIRKEVEELRALQVELLDVLEENVLEMEQYFEKSAAGNVSEQELETLRVRVLLNKHVARYYKLASRQQQLLKEKATAKAAAQVRTAAVTKTPQTEK